MKTELKVEGMSCGHCVRGVTNALEALQGVKSVEVSLAEKRAVVEHDATVGVQALISAIEEEGYQAEAA